MPGKTFSSAASVFDTTVGEAWPCAAAWPYDVENGVPLKTTMIACRPGCPTCPGQVAPSRRSETESPLERGDHVSFRN